MALSRFDFDPLVLEVVCLLFVRHKNWSCWNWICIELELRNIERSKYFKLGQVNICHRVEIVEYLLSVQVQALT